MKRRSMVFLLSFVAVASTTPAEGQDDRAVLTQALNDYASASHRFDDQRALNSYHEPLMLIAGPAVRVMATRAETEARPTHGTSWRS